MCEEEKMDCLWGVGEVMMKSIKWGGQLNGGKEWDEFYSTVTFLFPLVRFLTRKLSLV